MPDYAAQGSRLNRPERSRDSEYGGDAGPNYITPDGTPRSLLVGERAALLRREGMRPGSPYDPPRYGTYDPATNPDPGSVQLAPGVRRD